MRLLIFVSIAIGLLSSCSTLDKSRMLKTPTNYEFKQFVDSISYKEPYRVVVDDEITIQMYSNDGYNMVNIGGNRTNTGKTVGQKVQPMDETDLDIKLGQTVQLRFLS